MVPLIMFLDSESCRLLNYPKGPSQKYLEANEVKYFSLGGEGVGDFMVTISLFQKKLASCLCLPSSNEAKSRTEFHFGEGGGGQGRSEKYFTSLASRYF